MRQQGWENKCLLSRAEKIRICSGTERQQPRCVNIRGQSDPITTTCPHIKIVPPRVLAALRHCRGIVVTFGNDPAAYHRHRRKR